jgi:hypothetical protein
MHECRHTFASLMIAAGVNAKALSTFMGHANISITMDRYGHLMPAPKKKSLPGWTPTWSGQWGARKAPTLFLSAPLPPDRPEPD